MPKVGRMGRKQQRMRRGKVLELERQIRQVCAKLADIKNQTIASDPYRVRELYAVLGQLQRGLDKLVGPEKSDETVTRIYGELVKSQ